MTSRVPSWARNIDGPPRTLPDTSGGTPPRSADTHSITRSGERIHQCREGDFPDDTVTLMSVDTVSLTGWGRTAPTTAVRFRPRTHEEAAAAVRGRGPRGVIARGLGRSPGDAAQNAGGSVLDLTGLARIDGVDATMRRGALRRGGEPGAAAAGPAAARLAPAGRARDRQGDGRRGDRLRSARPRPPPLGFVRPARERPGTAHRRRRGAYGAAGYRPLRRHRRGPGADRGDPGRHPAPPARGDCSDVRLHRARRGPGRSAGPLHRGRRPAAVRLRLDRPDGPGPGDRTRHPHPGGARDP